MAQVSSAKAEVMATTASAWSDGGMELAAREHVLIRLNSLERLPLRELESVSDVPGAYFLFYAPTGRGRPRVGHQEWMDALYSAYTSGERAVYVGKVSTTGLRSRLAWHAHSVAAAGFDISDLYFATRPCATGAWATYLEAVALETATPAAFPWNQSGFGSRAPGRHRKGRCSAWDALHPGRPYVRSASTELDRAMAALGVATSAATIVPAALRWEPISH